MTTLLSKPASELTSSELENLLKKKQAEEREAINKKRKDYETLRENTIHELAKGALEINRQLANFKQKSFDDINTLYELLKEYSGRHKDSKGNFSIESENGQCRIKFSRQDLGNFDERSREAEKHILEFINKEFEGKDNTKKLILSLLERRKGYLDIKLVQRLYAMENDFNDENWREGIRLLKESWHPTETRDYITFYTKDENHQWQLINLNFASI